MPNEGSEWAHQVVHYINLPALFIQRDKCGSETKQNFRMFSSKLKI